MRYASAIYALGFVLTFGAAWNHNPETQDYPMSPAKCTNTVDAFGCAFMWPLYWSYRLFEPTPTPPQTKRGDE